MAMHLLAFVAYSVGWLKGGHSERFAVAVMITAYALSSVTYRWRIGDLYWATAAEDVVQMFVFGCLAVRANRWWLLVATAAFALLVLIHGLTVLTPDLSNDAAISARIGLWMIIYVALLAGVAERWLAGEPAVSDGEVWRSRRYRSGPDVRSGAPEPCDGNRLERPAST